MRNLLIILVVLTMASCNGSRVPRTQSSSVSSSAKDILEQEKSSIDSVQEFLLASAASDFRAHNPSPILGFRDVHLRRLQSQTGQTTYLLCGQFLTQHQEGKAQWTPFETIKTSGYEQYIGSARYCESASVMPGKEGDLSSILQARFDSLK